MTSKLPPDLGWAQVSNAPDVTTGFPPTKTVKLLLVVDAEQCIGGHPLAPQHGCGVTFAPTTAIGRPLTSTVGSPVSITPPAEFLSPTRHTGPGTYYPINILLLRTGLIPVVAST
jgi:hypothetical protein